MFDNRGQIKELDNETGEASAADERAPVKRQRFIGIAVAAAGFSVVMLLMLLAVRQPLPTAVPHARRPGISWGGDYSRHITVERVLQRLRTNAAGTRELEVRGYIRNKGNQTLESADLRCYFKSVAGDETSLEIPLIAASRLDDFEDGPLNPLTAREFDLRVGNFPDDLEPDILRVELVNLNLVTP